MTDELETKFSAYWQKVDGGAVEVSELNWYQLARDVFKAGYRQGFNEGFVLATRKESPIEDA